MKKRKRGIACIAALVIAVAFMPVSALTAQPAFAAGKKYDLPTKVTYYMKDGKKWKKIDTEHYTYEKGRLTYIHMDSSDEDPEWNDDITLKHTYRANGKLSKVVVRDENSKKTYYFNKKGRLTKVGKQKVKYSKGWISKFGKKKYKYTFKKGKPAKIRSSMGYVRFNSKGLVTEEQQTKMPKDWWGTGTENHYKYTYDDQGRVSKVTCRGEDTTKAVFSYETSVKTKSYKRWLATTYRIVRRTGEGSLEIVERITSDVPMYSTYN
ncbi:MAG: hypothetical protein IJ109_02255 [Firmicutes bacterium]|nr:hypothetical protein [Bacillota bacterium]